MGHGADIVREAYRLAEGSALDAAGFRALFTEDGTFDDMGWGISLRGDQIAAGVTELAQQIPDIRRELLGVHEFGDVVAVELRIQGTFRGTVSTPAGPLHGAGQRIDVPTADFFHLRENEIERFVCYNEAAVWLDQIGVHPDFEAAVAAANAAPRDAVDS